MKWRTLNARMKASTAPRRGETSQLATIPETCGQSIASDPIPASPKPISAPTMVCVVETGHPK